MKNLAYIVVEDKIMDKKKVEMSVEENIDEMKKSVEIIGNKAIIEASGNVNMDTIRSIAETGVNLISVGALTHSYKSFDISMKNLILL